MRGSRVQAVSNAALPGVRAARWRARAWRIAVALCLLTAAPLASAWHPQYPPWAGTPPSAACKVQALAPADGGEMRWDGVSTYRHAGIPCSSISPRCRCCSCSMRTIAPWSRRSP